MHHNLLWLDWPVFFLLHLKRQLIKPIANYGESIILVMHLKIVYLLNLLCMLEFYTALLVYLSSWPHSDFTPLNCSVPGNFWKVDTKICVFLMYYVNCIMWFLLHFTIKLNNTVFIVNVICKTSHTLTNNVKPTHTTTTLSH